MTKSSEYLLNLPQGILTTEMMDVTRSVAVGTWLWTTGPPQPHHPDLVMWVGVAWNVRPFLPVTVWSLS
jgi:hypothetical protein